MVTLKSAYQVVECKKYQKKFVKSSIPFIFELAMTLFLVLDYPYQGLHLPDQSLVNSLLLE